MDDKSSILIRDVGSGDDTDDDIDGATVPS
jgi:hypothetical protein